MAFKSNNNMKSYHNKCFLITSVFILFADILKKNIVDILEDRAILVFFSDHRDGRRMFSCGDRSCSNFNNNPQLR